MKDDSVSRFWENFIEKTKSYGVKGGAVRWHVVHAERYIKAHKGVRLADHTPDMIEAYLKSASRRPGLADWQYRQIIKSLQILFVELVRAEWAKAFPWKERAEAATDLGPDHATVARDNSGPGALSGVTGRIDRGGLVGQVSAAYPRHFERLTVHVRSLQYSIRTERSYSEWLARFIKFNDMKDPEQMPPQSIAPYLQHLVVNRNVSGSTQSQALNALIFFYKEVLGVEVGDIGPFGHSKKPRRLPVVLTREEVERLFGCIDDAERRLMASLLYGCGMRLMECVRLRVLDVDFGYQQIIVRNSKGGKDRVVPLPAKLLQPLEAQVEIVRAVHQEDLAGGYGSVYLPAALSRKYPNAPKEFRWHPVRG